MATPRSRLGARGSKSEAALSHLPWRSNGALHPDDAQSQSDTSVLSESSSSSEDSDEDLPKRNAHVFRHGKLVQRSPTAAGSSTVDKLPVVSTCDDLPTMGRVRSTNSRQSPQNSMNQRQHLASSTSGNLLFTNTRQVFNSNMMGATGSMGAAGSMGATGSMGTAGSMGATASVSSTGRNATVAGQSTIDQLPVLQQRTENDLPTFKRNRRKAAKSEGPAPKTTSRVAKRSSTMTPTSSEVSQDGVPVTKSMTDGMVVTRSTTGGDGSPAVHDQSEELMRGIASSGSQTAGERGRSNFESAADAAEQLQQNRLQPREPPPRSTSQRFRNVQARRMQSQGNVISAARDASADMMLFSKTRRPESARPQSARSMDVQLEYRPRMNFLLTISSQSALASEYISAISQELKNVTVAARCSIFFVDEVREEMWCMPSEGDALRVPRSQGIAGLVAREGDTVHTAEPRSHEAWDDSTCRRLGCDVWSLACIPVKHCLDRDSTVGVIEIANKQGGGSFSAQDVKVSEDIARLISDSFYRHRWKALESFQSRGDSEAQALISQTRTDKVDEPAEKETPGASQTAEKAMEPLSWVDVPLPEGREISIAQMRSLNFNILECTGDQLVALVEPVMQHTGVIERCHVPPDRLRNWAQAAKKLYRDNPFHNWYHGFSVFQMCYYQMYTSVRFGMFSSLEAFSLLIATLCHDLDHPGFTNAFMIDSASPLALRHNDISVLENHHANLCCELLRRSATAIVAGLDAAAQKVLRRYVIKCILDTDMAHHGEMVRKLQDPASIDDKQLMMSAIVHTSDLSAQVLPWNVASQWEEMISTEFTNQAYEEKEAGRSPLPFMNFQMTDIKLRGKLQRDFLDFVLIPLWDPFTQLIPELRPCYRNLIKNRSYYHQRHLTGEDPAYNARAKRIAF